MPVLAAPRALVNGRDVALNEATLPITDDGAARGDGAFETIGVWDGRPFRLPEHLRRLAGSLRAICLPEPDHEVLRVEVASLLDGAGQVDGALRIYVTASGTRVLTFTPPPARREPRHLVPEPAPWIQPLGTFGPAGAKTMSYMPNMAATRAAQLAGADDALLVSLDGDILEGPTFCVLWVTEGVLHAVETGLGIVDSVSRRTLLELAEQEGIETRVRVCSLDELGRASEVMICSAVRPVIAIERVASWTYGAQTPVRDRLAAALEARRRGG